MKVGDELVKVEGMTVSELDMIYIESVLKSLSSVDVTLRSGSVRCTTANQQPPSRPPSPIVQSSQHDQIAEAAAASSAEAAPASDAASAGTKDRRTVDTVVRLLLEIISELV